MNQARPSQEMIEEGYKQVKLNARAAALDRALQARAHGARTESYSAEELIADAQKIEAYMLDGISPPQPSNIITPTRRN